VLDPVHALHGEVAEYSQGDDRVFAQVVVVEHVHDDGDVADSPDDARERVPAERAERADDDGGAHEGVRERVERARPSRVGARGEGVRARAVQVNGEHGPFTLRGGHISSDSLVFDVNYVMSRDLDKLIDALQMLFQSVFGSRCLFQDSHHRNNHSHHCNISLHYLLIYTNW